MALPQTGFEQRGLEAPWTTFSEEADYCDALLAEVPAITRFQAGVGETGLPIWCYKFGTGSAHIMFVGQQHGPELAARDALLSRLRDWATDPEWAAYLGDVTVLVIPTARPDSQTERNNANDVNLNRDHMQLTQSETVAIQQVISDYSPDVVVDVHEGANITNEYATSKVLNPNIHEGLFTLSADLESAVRAAIEGDGYTWEPYQDWNITGPEFFSNAAGVRHAVGLLLESRRRPSTDEDAGDRWLWHTIGLDAVLSWHEANMSVVAAAVDDSRGGRRGRVELVTGTSESGVVVDPSPYGYLVTSADESALADPIDVFGLNVVETAQGRVLDAETDTGVIVHYLASPSSPQRLVSGVPLFAAPTSTMPAESPYPRYRINAGAGAMGAVMVRLGTGDGPVTIWP